MHTICKQKALLVHSRSLRQDLEPMLVKLANADISSQANSHSSVGLKQDKSIRDRLDKGPCNRGADS